MTWPVTVARGWTKADFAMVGRSISGLNEVRTLGPFQPPTTRARRIRLRLRLNAKILYRVIRRSFLNQDICHLWESSILDLIKSLHVRSRRLRKARRRLCRVERGVPRKALRLGAAGWAGANASSEPFQQV